MSQRTTHQEQTMKTIDNSQALETFVELAALIKSRLERLQGAAENHFDLAPEEVHWGHVGDLTRYAEALKDITDSVFNEGD